MNTMDHKTIVLGVTGGIAAYKAASVASLLVQAGAKVHVVMTQAAQKFVQPLTFSAITHTPVYTDTFAPWSEGFSGHVDLAKRADLVIVAPATASTIARLALGLAEDFLGLIALATHAPMIIAPAMEDRMFTHPATRGHIATLVERGVIIVGPDHGRLASGAFGEGRLVPPEVIVEAAWPLLRRSTQLLNKKVVVTAGGTQEPLDPVRYIGNRSSGTMGYELASAAIAAGAQVTLITAPTSLRPPVGSEIVHVSTALDMHREVERASADADVLIMAAAVADFRPETRSHRKLKKRPDQEFMDMRLVRNPDILGSIDSPDLLKIGFAAETEDLLQNAKQKLEAKRLDMIVANDAEKTIGSPTSTAIMLTSGGNVTSLPSMSKAELAIKVVDAIAMLLEEGKPRAS